MIPRKALTLIRYASGQYQRGKWVQGAPTEMQIRASVQPISGKTLRQTFGNEKITEGYTLYTNDDIRTASEEQQTDADRVVIGEAEYKVVSVETWENSLIPHRKATVVRLEPGQ